uniref:Uncharacterized protein n=1 Tax=Tetraselmis chuii TaxID=63592 RepID=A0A7S1X273_9CHLO|mmetsp:Transcript_23090/g.40991  ORF Transcript_23090/g.40991 Transcript_23090/m.40991 type:complete len:361 (+) Transcript_23090:125-1207(+)|eukprot:CAMPEP_0177785702 /NCGR_PEP_ID=MMETSP0491_2-20121128/20496_1 /TAXON_ID=63592 /ORGANISM="Tetraselmis chuii, Strain PLY429" /LENGTH=360 /DNA_ID=CAMNT_0019306795 /DNA_START=74 /DNA_END=1156 /DNA_ORIENTATION=+
MAVADFDLAAYLQEDGDAWSLDGWDLAGTVPSARASDTGAHLASEGAAGSKADAAPLLLDDRLLDELFGGSFINPHTPTPTAPQNQHASFTPDISDCTTGGALGDSRVSEGRPGTSNKMDALQQQLNALQQQQQRLQIPGDISQPGAPLQAPAKLDGSPPVGIELPSSRQQQSQQQGGSRKRRAEDPNVLEMARKLLEARGAEQEAQLVTETGALCADNHRLISYLKQLGEKLNKARTENGLLKRMVAETSGAQACAMQAEHQASQVVEPARKRLLLGITHSVADKVSALSVQHQVDRRDGAPLPCLRSTPPTAHKTEQVPAEAPATPTPTRQTGGGGSVNALVDLLRIMQSMQKAAPKA